MSLAVPPGRPLEFGFVQMRPLALMRESEAVEIGDVDPAAVLCRSQRVLGNGRIEGLRDLVVVDFQRFERARSPEAAAEVGRLNRLLVADRIPYALVGVGRWGSRDPWLGIPVTWDQVSGAQVIVEAGLRDLSVTPSQGTHFFQNLTSFDVGYFTVNPENGDGEVDWDWLSRAARALQPCPRAAHPPRAADPGADERQEPTASSSSRRPCHSELVLPGDEEPAGGAHGIMSRLTILTPSSKAVIAAASGRAPISRWNETDSPGARSRSEPFSRCSRRVLVMAWVEGSRPHTYSPSPVIFQCASTGSSAARQRTNAPKPRARLTIAASARPFESTRGSVGEDLLGKAGHGQAEAQVLGEPGARGLVAGAHGDVADEELRARADHGEAEVAVVEEREGSRA